MFTLDWLTLSQFVTCWKMHVAYKGFAFFCYAVSTSLCIYPRMLTDRLSEPLRFSCWHREKDAKKAAMEILSWKGLWSLFFVSYRNTRTTPNKDMHATTFHIFMGLSFHIFKMLLTYDFYVWFSSCPSFLHAGWALDISCFPHDNHCALFAACPYLCVCACMCLHQPLCAIAVNQTEAMLPSTRVCVININFTSDSPSHLH